LQNWPRWRKEVNFWALMVVVGLIGGMKTVFISTNAAMAVSYDISYTAVAALTGVPLILSAITGLASLIVARIWGKRPVYLASLALVFIGSMWNMRTDADYSQCVAARVFQGLGWGAFDTLILSSIQDTYFVCFSLFARQRRSELKRTERAQSR
jgi:MFS family permease